VRQINLAIC